MSILDELNENQAEAVLETEGYVRVIAGAGSGKTKLLVSRYAYLVRDYGIDPSNILCVTFTNKAAGEMKRRIRELVGGEYDTALICTYHGFCARLIRDDAEKLFLSRDSQILDTVQQKTILGEIYQKRELKLDYASFEMILKKIAEYKSLSYFEYVPNMTNPGNGQIMASIVTQTQEIIEEYMQRQKAVNALDFHDLMSFALYLLETNEEVRKKWQEKLNYIQVDEFQDSSAREMSLVNILSGCYRNLMIVGDPDQNIYEWRGSDVKLLVDFDKTHDPTKTIFLSRNYRSTPQILSCANNLIDNNRLRLKKDLYTLLPPGAEVTHYHSKSDDKETEQIATVIKEAVRKNGRKYSDFAVLYRSGFLSRLVEKRFAERGIPYEIYGGVKFFQRMEVLDMIAYLRVIAYGDDLSLKRVINKPRRRFGRVKLAALEELHESCDPQGSGERPGMLDLLSENLDREPFKNSDAGCFVRLIEGIRSDAGKMRITEIVSRTAAESGYEEYIRSLGDEERYENLMEFKRVADEFERNFGENVTLPQFLQQLSLQSSEDAETNADKVKLMTIHAAKGLEFPAVFVIGFSEGIFPSAKTIEERKLLGLEEERRLCYVAITRAREQLYLMDSEGFSQNGIKKLPSRFLREIGLENYTRIGVISKELDLESNLYSRKLDADFAVAESSGLKPGDTVEHHVFGTGTVVKCDERKGCVTVHFDRIGQQRILSADYFKREHEKPKLPERLQIPERSQAGGITGEKPKAKALPAETEKPESVDKPEEPVKSEAAADKSSDTSTEDKEPELKEVERIIVKKDPKEKPDNDNDGGGEPQEEQDKPVAVSDELKKKLADSQNLWKRDDVPHTGWICVGVTDLGEPAAVCEMCGYQIIRYVHHMVHPNYRPLDVGCICAGKMEGDIEAAKRRENELKQKQARRGNFMKRPWKKSKNGNEYMKFKEHVIVLYQHKGGIGWSYSLDQVFCRTLFKTREEAIAAAYEALEKALGN